MRVKNGWAALGLLAMLSSRAMAVPNYQTTTLVPEDWMYQDPSLKDVIEFLPKLTVYQDSLDPNQYYYLPPFRAVSGVAGSAIVNDKQIERSDEVESSFKTLYGDLAKKEFATLQSQYLAVMGKISQTNDPRLLDNLQKVAATIKAAYDEARARAEDYSKIIPAGLKKSQLEYISAVLSQAGFAVTDTDSLADINTKTSQLNRSNGGMFTVNVFGGFRGNEGQLMQKFHVARAAKGLPKIKVSLIPAENFTWKPLAETIINPEGTQGEGIPIFRNIKGGGNFVGATINGDLTLDGARKFKTPLEPTVLPIFAEASLIQKYPTFTADLSCYFKTGWSVKGRTDVRDGLIIYNNDITTNLVADDISDNGDKPCTVKFEGGGGNASREDAYRRSLEIVQQRIVDLYWTRSNMAHQEKVDYFNAVMADVQANRHTGANDGWAGVATSYFTGGWGGVFVGAASQASRFYWHTNKQNVTSTSSFTWNQRIVEDGNTKVSLPMPVKICVGYSPAAKGYVACSEAEEVTATNVTEAANKAASSPECAGTSTTAECAASIENNRPVNPDSGIVLPPEL